MVFLGVFLYNLFHAFTSVFMGELIPFPSSGLTPQETPERDCTLMGHIEGLREKLLKNTELIQEVVHKEGGLQVTFKGSLGKSFHLPYEKLRSPEEELILFIMQQVLGS
jgi:hypothetical protein